MPYKIYTYTNPYELNRTSFWPEIKSLPHFCVARTLVNGLVDIMRDSIDGLICPLDDLIKHKDIYGAWEGNISKRIEQHSYLTKLFDQTKQKSADPRKEEFFGALHKNQGDFLDAIRLFIELGIPADSLHPDLSLKEQKAFIRVLSKIQSENEPVFRFPSAPSKETLKKTVDSLAVNELDEYKDQMSKSGRSIDEKHLRWLEKAIQTTKRAPLKGIVVHGVHQFSPSQIRLITEIEKLGLTVYFLFNYQSKYSEIYDTWMTIYGNFDAQIEMDKNGYAVIPPEQQNESYALATALGLLCQGKYSPANPNMRASYEKYNACDFIKFANLTEYAHFVSDRVDTAKKKFYDSLSPLERSSHHFSSRKVLGLLDEQVYTANRDIHDLLNIYFPEFSTDRHFLSYPIGQFFAGLYHLWDWEKGEISFDLAVIRECISSGLLKASKPELLLRISYILEVILEKVKTLSGEKGFLQQMDLYLKRYDEVASAPPKTKASEMKGLSIYDSETITKEEIRHFVKAVQELNQCGVDLFGQSHQDYVEFGTHFQRLENFINQRKTDFATEVETALINDLLGRFDYVVSSTKDTNGTFHDLRHGLYFYLKQKKSEKPVDWIVKNFEQIDGDILQSRKQHFIHKRKLEDGDRSHKEKIYHFAALSDRDMNVSMDDLLPWPLTDQFILKAYTPIDLQFQVYYSALSERSSFLRYALFYGLYFNQCGVRLSYVEEVQDELTEPFMLLKILGLKEKDFKDVEKNTAPPSIVLPQDATLPTIHPTADHLRSMMLCPHRYLMDSIVEKAPIANSDFLYQKVFENALIAGAWKRCSEKPKQTVEQYIVRIIKNEADQLKPYFFFWDTIQFLDICRRATNYFIHHILNLHSGGYVAKFNPSDPHISIRKHYGTASIYINISEHEPQNPYPAFEAATHKDGIKKVYKLHRFQERVPVEPAFKQDMCDFLSKRIDVKETVASDWCTYCPYRNICLDPFIRKD